MLSKFLTPPPTSIFKSNLLTIFLIISGGVSSIDDIKKAKELNNKNIEGIIVGKAIYDGDVKLEELAKEIDA